MITKRAYKNVTWIDIESPTQDDVRNIVTEYGVHPVVAEELRLPTVKSKVDSYDDHIYLVLHFPTKRADGDGLIEIDWIIGKDFLITVRYDSENVLHRFARMLDVNTVLKHNTLVGEHGGYLFFYMMYRLLHDELYFVKDALSDIERQIFEGKEKEMVREVSEVSRELLSFRHAIARHGDVLASFNESAQSLFSREFTKHMTFIEDEHRKIDRTVSIMSETLTELRETNNSLLETKQNSIMMAFTAITIISSLATIISSWFLIEDPNRPFKGTEHEFWWVGLTMLVISIILAIIMRIKRWL
jgi:magnesium transporter